MSQIALQALSKVKHECMLHANASSNEIMNGGQGERLNLIIGKMNALNLILGIINQVEKQIQSGEDIQGSLAPQPTSSL